MMAIKRALNFDISGIDACVVSHQHGDHSKYIKDLLKCGVKVLALPDVFDAWGIKNRVFCNAIQPRHGYKVGDWRIIALPVVHDVPCVGFLIEHDEMGRTLFITDTMMLEYKVPRVSHFMLECNYADDVLQANIDSGVVLPVMRERLLRSHMELHTTKNIIKANDKSMLEDVILVHLSEHNSDRERFKREIESVAGVPTYIALPGLEIQLGKML